MKLIKLDIQNIQFLDLPSMQTKSQQIRKQPGIYISRRHVQIARKIDTISSYWKLHTELKTQAKYPKRNSKDMKSKHNTKLKDTKLKDCTTANISKK